MSTEDIVFAQGDFMQKGGLYVHAMRAKIKSGELRKDYVYQDYPKNVRLNERVVEVEKSTEDIKGKTIKWTESQTVWDEITVYSEEEEERTLAGGKTSQALEDERQTLIRRCRDAAIKVDITWSAIRLKRELGDKLDAPEPVDERDALMEKLARLKEIADLKAQIAAMEAGVAPEDEAAGLRVQLEDLGVHVDLRWRIPRLREELEKATAPAAVA